MKQSTNGGRRRRIHPLSDSAQNICDMDGSESAHVLFNTLKHTFYEHTGNELISSSISARKQSNNFGRTASTGRYKIADEVHLPSRSAPPKLSSLTNVQICSYIIYIHMSSPIINTCPIERELSWVITSPVLHDHPTLYRNGMPVARMSPAHPSKLKPYFAKWVSANLGGSRAP